MIRLRKVYLIIAILPFLITACKKDKPEELDVVLSPSVPEFFGSTKSNPNFELISDAQSKIKEPQDLDFNPTRPNELWIINKGLESTGGSTVMLTEVGSPNQKYDYRQDGNAWHFMSLPSAISFSHTGNWATSANVLDANHQGGTFTGPTLWSGDLSIYARYAGPGTNGSHLDMLHGSPYSMGIESEMENVYWVFDGYHNHIVRYDFAVDHGPGNHNHDDGKILRYPEMPVIREPNIPSHLAFDENQQWLYVVDGGNKRILRMLAHSAYQSKSLPIINEQLADHWEMAGLVWEVFVPANPELINPAGIAVKGNRVFVSDYNSGDIICFDSDSKVEIARINTGEKGILGLTIGPDGKIYFVNALSNKVIRIDPN